MNVLDENIIESQCKMLLSWRIRYRQIGSGIGEWGMTDAEIIRMLQHSQRPTFFTRDDDFFDKKLCHPKYCLVTLAVRKNEAAVFIRRLLKHPQFNTVGKRVGAVIRVSHTNLLVWRVHSEQPDYLKWLD